MIEVYADGYTAYSSRLNGYALLRLNATVALNKGGTAEITMPPGHPAFGYFVNYKTIVEIYRSGELLFRGRALYPSDDFYNRRTITCEGERCFLRDAVMRPYLYQDEPAVIFSDIIGIYNSQVEQSKQFQVGDVTVKDKNDYIRLESETAEQVGDTIDKLVDRCGGYIVFTTNHDGQRVINWYASLGYRTTQAIEFGENMLDFSRTQASTDLATRIIPYGAKDEETGERITIRSVNDDQDYIEDAEAVSLRGVIARPVYWDDVTEPANLLAKAKQYLANSKMIITTLELTAVDLSSLDRSIDSYRVGDIVHVKSNPHGVDDDFQLTQRVYNLLDPSQDKVTMGKDLATLTGEGVAGDRETIDQLHKTESSIKTDYKIGIAQAVQASEKKMSSIIEQTADSIRIETSENYAKTEVVKKVEDDLANQSQIIQTQESRLSDLEVNANAITATVQRMETETKTSLDGVEESISQLAQRVDLSLTPDQVEIAIEEKLSHGVDSVTTKTGFTFDEDGLNIRKSGSEMTTMVSEDGMKVVKSGQDMLVANSQGVQATNLHANTYLIISERARLEAYGTDRVACFWIGG